MKTYNVAQGSPEWKALRLGLPTASEFDALVTPEWKIRTGQGPETYLYQKLCEKILGFAPDANSFAMEQGAILESEARPFYEFEFSQPVQVVGFCTSDDGRIGCSPDGLIGETGGLEIKCPQPATHLKYLLGGELPKEYRAQVQGAMLVTGRPAWTFMSYSRQFPPLVLRVERDTAAQEVLKSALEIFLEKFDEKLALVSAMRGTLSKSDQSREDAYKAECAEWERQQRAGGAT
jgi:hypothetical protein